MLPYENLFTPDEVKSRATLSKVEGEFIENP